MALSNLSNDINKLNKQIQEIAKELNKTNFKLFNPGEVNEAQAALKGLREELREFNSELSYIAGAFRDALNELSKQRVALTDSKRALKSISNIAIELTTAESERTLISDKQLDKLEKQAKSQFKLLELAKQSGTLKKEELKEVENALKEQKTFEEGVKRIRKIQKEIKSDSGVRLFGGLESISKAIPGLSQFTSAFTEASKAATSVAFENQRNKEFLKEALKTGKGLTKERIRELGLSEKLKDKNGEILTGTAAAAKIRKLGLQNSIKQQSTLAAGFKALGPIIAKTFSFGTLLKSLIAVDKQSGALAKNFGISYDQALALNSKLNNIANVSGELNVTTANLVESFTTLNNRYGTFATLNSKTLTDFTKLTKQAYLSNEAALALQDTTYLTGKGLEESTEEFLGQSAALAAQKGLALNQKQILESIKDVSTATLLQLQGQPEALAEAVVNAKALGLSLDKVEQIASSLLSFESSISAELEAELLTGKQLNLERARAAALNGDIATVAEEIAKQVGTAADFTKMNVIQQEALAKSVGMTRNDLAKSLMEREAMAKLSGQEGDTAQERFNNLVKEVGLEEAKKRLGDEQLGNLLSQQNTQERFTAAVEKLKEVFVSIAEPILQIVSPFMDLVTTILPAVNALLNPILKYAEEIAAAFGAIYLTNKLMIATNAFLLAQEQAKTTQKGIQIGFTETLLTMMGFENALAGYRLAREEGMNVLRAIGVALEETKLGAIIAQGAGIIKNIGKLAIENAARLVGMTTALTTNAAVTFGTGVAIAIGAALAGVAAIKAIKADDMVQDGYGKRTILSPEGAIRLNDKDTIVAGTNLFPKANDLLSPPSGEMTRAPEGTFALDTPQKSDTPQSSPSANINLAETNALLKQLISAVKASGNTVIEIDGNKLGKVIKQNEVSMG